MLHLSKCVLVLLRAIRCRAIRRYYQFVVPQVSVVGSEEYAIVTGETSEHELASAEVFQQEVKRGGKKPECFGFRTK